MFPGTADTSNSKPLLRVFGLPIHVRAGFVVFLCLAIALNPGAFGFWLAVAIGLLTITHELGHALAARRFGAEAEILLDMIAGYTSYMPSRALSRTERSLIAVAGPMAQVVPGLAVLAVLGVNPLSLSSVDSTDIGRAFWWAGPVLGLFNLFPLLPLDGGTIVASGLDAVFPGRGRRYALRYSIVATVLLAAAILLFSNVRPLALFAIVLLILQFQYLRNERRIDRYRHDVQRRAGKRAEIQALLDANDLAGAATRGASLFRAERDPAVAIIVARSAARLAEVDTSLAWLQAAGHAAADPRDVLAELDRFPDFAIVRSDPGASALRRSLGG